MNRGSNKAIQLAGRLRVEWPLEQTGRVLAKVSSAKLSSKGFTLAELAGWPTKAIGSNEKAELAHQASLALVVSN